MRSKKRKFVLPMNLAQTHIAEHCGTAWQVVLSKLDDPKVLDRILIIDTILHSVCIIKQAMPHHTVPATTWGLQ